MPKRTRIFVVMAALMMVFGAAEVRTGFRHEFLGLRGADSPRFTTIGVALGLCYLAAGALVLVYRRRALFAASAILAVDVVGRIGLVLGGEFPVGNARQVLGIAAGTAIAAFFGVVVGLRARSLPSRG
jgi:hypothetical protein